MAQCTAFTPEEIALRERVSLKLAFSTHEYIHTYSPTRRTGKAAVFAYNGVVFNKLQAKTFSPSELEFAQSHLRILSALYGILRPLDLIQPYRLDMTSGMVYGLYDYWRNTVSREVATLLKEDDNLLINLTSGEYFKLLDFKLLPKKTRVITPVFKYLYHGKYTVNSLFAKQARGWMARFIIENQITDPEHLQAFTEGGYFFRPELSGDTEWVFTR